MPQCTGQCGRACCRLGVHPLGEPESPSQTLSVSLKDADSEWETKRAEIHLLSDISGWLPARAPPLPAPWPPLAEHRSREHPTLPPPLLPKPLEHRPPRSHGFSRTFANQRITVTRRASERRCQRVGSSFRRKTNCTFYILHYMWLCTICWYPDDGVHVWNIWYLAFSRRHEMKCIIHRVTSVFATVVTTPLSVVSSSHPRFGFFRRFLNETQI